MGLDAWKLTYAYQGLNQKLIGPEGEATIIDQGAAGVKPGTQQNDA